MIVRKKWKIPAKTAVYKDNKDNKINRTVVPAIDMIEDDILAMYVKGREYTKDGILLLICELEYEAENETKLLNKKDWEKVS